jgi:hypothetical protein
MPLELDPVVQRFDFDIAGLERGIATAQQRLAAFQQDLERGTTAQQRYGRFSSIGEGERALRQLQSSLGGAERANARLMGSATG